MRKPIHFYDGLGFLQPTDRVFLNLPEFPTACLNRHFGVSGEIRNQGHPYYHGANVMSRVEHIETNPHPETPLQRNVHAWPRGLNQSFES